MSQNIDHVSIIRGSLTIAPRKARDFMRENEDDLPECHLFDHKDIKKAVANEDDDTPVELKPFWWSGEHSGHAYDGPLDDLLALTQGTADLVFHWHGGDLTGVRVHNGKVTDHKVILTLED